jgi:hypothetical protein
VSANTWGKSRGKTFSLHWGSGIVDEEVQTVGPYHRPTIQLLKSLDGQAGGS